MIYVSLSLDSRMWYDQWSGCGYNLTTLSVLQHSAQMQGHKISWGCRENNKSILQLKRECTYQFKCNFRKIQSVLSDRIVWSDFWIDSSCILFQIFFSGDRYLWYILPLPTAQYKAGVCGIVCVYSYLLPPCIAECHQVWYSWFRNNKSDWKERSESNMMINFPQKHIYCTWACK